MRKVAIYIDGVSTCGQGIGGYGAITLCCKEEEHIFGVELKCPHQRMELVALLNALKSLKEESQAYIYTDSDYIFSSFNAGWLDVWKNNDWKKQNGEAVEYASLWQDIIDACLYHRVSVFRIKGARGEAMDFNAKCEALAKAAVNDYRENLGLDAVSDFSCT